MSSRVELDPALAATIAERVMKPRVEAALDMLCDAARTKAPGTRVWMTMRDERVRRTHFEADGQVIPDNLRFILDKPGGVGQEMARHPRDPALSTGNAINCFPGTTMAQGLGAIRALYRAPYAAAMLTVRTARGVLTGTPNHPVLTPAGLRPLGSLDVGDHLIHRGIREAPVIEAGPAGGAALSASTAPHVDTRPATLAQMFDAASRAFGHHRVSGRSVNLYGDRFVGEVEVVALDWELARHHDAALVQRVREFALPTSDAHAASRVSLGLADEFADKIIGVEVDYGFRGHVYTLTTSSGHYVAGGFVVGNCRCDDPAIPHLLRDSIHTTPVTIEGTRVHGFVETRFPRAAESEFGTTEDTAAHFMTQALREVALRLSSGQAR